MKYLVPLLLLSVQTVYAETTQKIFNKVAPSVVTVEAFDEENNPQSEGSGVVLSSNQIITNCHVTEDAKTIKIKTFEQKEFKASLARTDIKRDLCLLQVEGLKAPAVSLRTSDIEIGEQVYAVGNPLGIGLSVSKGLISNKLSDNNNEPKLITNSVVSPGSSGGGLFDRDGKLIGVTTAILVTGQNVNVALSVPSIQYVQKHGELTKPPQPVVPRDRDWAKEAEILHNKSEWAALKILAESWKEVYPTSGDAVSYLGLALNNLGKYDESIQLLSEFAQRFPSHALTKIYLVLGRKV